MKKSIVAIVGFGMLAVSAKAALVCATPQEMKLLQSAALQQQLTVAALSCHMNADYNRFVTAYRGQLVQSDQALKAFFAVRARGEDYNAYKTRIANEVSLRSLHDARFCDSAQKVFDMALGRGEERRGLAPEPPQLIDTGYEGCRPVEDKLLTAAALPRPAPRPQTKVAIAKPVPRPAFTAAKPAAQPKLADLRVANSPPLPKPVLSAEAQHALALAPHVPVPQQRPQVAAAAPKPMPRVAATAAPKPVAAAAAKPYVPLTTTATPKPAPLPKLASAAPPTAMLAPKPAPAAPPRAEPEQPAWDGPSADEQPGDTSDEPPQRFADEPQQRPAAEARPQWHARAAYRPNDEEQVADDRMPNAYRPGSAWMGDAGPVSRPMTYAPPPRWHRPHTYMVLAPDGRWVVVIGRPPRWMRE